MRGGFPPLLIDFLLKKGKGIDSKAKEELLFQKNQRQKK
jgi:hypothetical protein